MDVEAYLRRIEYDGSREPTASTLRDLHRQHLYTVPFENLDIALGVPIRLDPAALFDKVVVRQRGGFCYELNGLFGELLKAMGFRVEMLSARVHRADGGFGREFDHMLLRVELEVPQIADVGFGDSSLDPVPMRSVTAQQDDAPEFAVVAANGAWDLVRRQSEGGAYVPDYRFTDAPRQLSDFSEMCLFHQTSPESHFTQNRVCTKALPNGRVTISGMRLIETRNGVRQEREFNSQRELRECLSQQFGIKFPETIDWSRLMR